MGYAILDQRGGDSLTATTLDGYSLLADTTVSSATTTVNFTGLNIGWGDELLLVSDVIGASVCENFIYVNGNTTGTNYYSQYINVVATGVGANRLNSSYIGGVGSGSKTFIQTNIKVTNNGFFSYQTNTSRYYSSSSIEILKWYGTSTFTISSITSLAITASVTNAIGIGSRFQLYKSGGGASRTWAIT